GVSTNPVRPSYFVMRYLSMRNYRVIPINPGAAGQTLFGETVLASIEDIPIDIPVDMLDIFRRPAFVPDLVDAAMEHLGDRLRTIWMQVGVEHTQAAAKATDAGLQVIQNRCPKIEYQRLNGELRRAGFNTGIISSKLPRY
ncbi:MAG: CoA-binding protein, partial [Amylibacter sp.]